MATTLTVSNLSAKVSLDYANDTLLIPLAISPSLTLNLSYAQGTGAGQADRVHISRRTLAGAANESLDLAGSLTDPFGAVLTFARIKAIIILLQPTTAAAFLRVGGAAANGFVNWVADATDKVIVRNGPKGGFLALGCGDATGYPVTAGTGDLLKIENGDASLAATYDLCVIGASV